MSNLQDISAKTTISLSLVLTATQALAATGLTTEVEDVATTPEGEVASHMLSSIDGWRCLAENYHAMTNVIKKDGETLYDLYKDEGVVLGAGFGENDFTDNPSPYANGACYGNCYANCHQNCYGDCHGDDS